MLNLTPRKMLDFFKTNSDDLSDRFDANIQEDVKIFHAFIGQLKKQLNHYKNTGETLKNYPNIGELLFSAESLQEEPFNQSSNSYPSIPAPASQSNGLEFFDHFRQFEIYDKALVSFKKWMLKNEMPEIYVFRSLNSNGKVIALCLINPTIGMRHF